MLLVLLLFKTQTLFLDLGAGMTKTAYVDARGVPEVATNIFSKRLTPSFLSLYPPPNEKHHTGNVEYYQPYLGDASIKKLRSRHPSAVGLFRQLLDYPEDYGRLISESMYYNHTLYQLPRESLLALFIKSYTNQLTDGRAYTEYAPVVPMTYTIPQRMLLRRSIEAGGYACAEPIDDVDAIAAIYTKRGRAKGPTLFVDVGASSVTAFVLQFTQHGAEVLSYERTEADGGHYLTTALATYLYRKHNLKGTMASVIQEAELIKQKLSILKEYSTYIDDDHYITVARSELETLAQTLIDTTVSVAQRAVASFQIHRVEILGGGSRIPSLQDALAKAMLMKLSKTLNADESLVLGAAQVSDVRVQHRTFPYEVAFDSRLVCSKGQGCLSSIDTSSYGRIPLQYQNADPYLLHHELGYSVNSAGVKNVLFKVNSPEPTAVTTNGFATKFFVDFEPQVDISTIKRIWSNEEARHAAGPYHTAMYNILEAFPTQWRRYPIIDKTYHRMKEIFSRFDEYSGAMLDDKITEFTQLNSSLDVILDFYKHLDTLERLCDVARSFLANAKYLGFIDAIHQFSEVLENEEFLLHSTTRKLEHAEPLSIDKDSVSTIIDSINELLTAYDDIPSYITMLVKSPLKSIVNSVGGMLHSFFQ